MHKALRCTCSLKFPPFLFSHPPYQFCIVTWPLCCHLSPSLSLIGDCSNIFNSPVFSKCCLSCLLIFTCSVCILSVISCCDPLLSVPSRCLRKSVCWISCCIILLHLLLHLVLVAVCYKKILHVLSPLFPSWFIGIWFVFSSPRIIHLLFYTYNHHWEAWNSLPDCLAGQVG